MAKLYFRYGTMDSAKSMNLLAVAHNYRKQGKRVVLMKPRLDNRFGVTKISSRCGLEAEADLMVDLETTLDPRDFRGLDCVLVDEAQFLAPSVIEELRRITIDPGVPVICYGLRTDYRGKGFPGALELLSIADALEELKTICRCGRKASMVIRHDGKGERLYEGAQVQVGGNETYESVCPRRFYTGSC